MKTKKDFIQHYTRGTPTKYDQEKHIGLLFELFSNGENVAAFLAEAAVSRQTFYNWIKAHKEFAEAYEAAVNICQREWEKYPKDNPDFNISYWAAMMRNRFSYGKSRVRKAKDNTPLARIEAVWIDLEEGNISGSEATQFASVVKTQADILDKQSYEPGEHKVETAEAIMETVNAIQKVLDSRKKDKEV
jgi:hypothetical protein